MCDEAHEMVRYEVHRKGACVPSSGLRTLLGFSSCFRWYVTGTPFPHGVDSLRGALRVSYMCHVTYDLKINLINVCAASVGLIHALLTA